MESIISNFMDKSRPAVKLFLQKSMRSKIPEYELKQNPLLGNTRVEKVLRDVFCDEYGGIRVIAAPPGSGKTTYVRGYVNKFIEDGGSVKMFESELENKSDFYIRFGDAERRFDLFDVLPRRSAIVIDQLEHFRELPTEIESLLCHLAYESRRTAECNVIVMLSNTVLAHKVLELNGLDKIKSGGKACDFEWDNHQVKAFVEEGCKGWIQKDKEELIRLGCIARCPTLLHSILTICPLGFPADTTFLEKTAVRFGDAWEQFSSSGL